MKSTGSITKRMKSAIMAAVMFCVYLGIFYMSAYDNMVQAAENGIHADVKSVIDVNDDINNDLFLSDMQPKTGDNSNIAIYIVLLVVAAGGALVLMVLKKKNDDDDESEENDDDSEE